MTKSKTDSSKKREKKAERTDAEYIKRGAEKVTDKEVEQVAENAEEIEDKFKSSGRLGRYIEDARLMLSLIKDYWRGDYRKILSFTVTAIAFTLLYVLNPLDLIPDVLPIVGFVDDALAFSVAFKLVEKDLMNYKKWKLQQK